MNNTEKEEFLKELTLSNSTSNLYPVVRDNPP